MKLYYNDNGNKILLTEVITNHSMSVDDALNLSGIDMDEWAEEQGWDNWNWEALEMDWTDTSLKSYCEEWLGITGLEPFEGWSLEGAQAELSVVREDFPEVTAQELYETMRAVLAEVTKQDAE